VRKDFERLMGVTTPPLFNTVYAWPNSMPQYVVGHGEKVNRIRHAIAPLAGLTLTGNYFDGVGMPDSIRHAKEAAKQIESSIV